MGSKPKPATHRLTSELPSAVASACSVGSGRARIGRAAVTTSNDDRIDDRVHGDPFVYLGRSCFAMCRLY